MNFKNLSASSISPYNTILVNEPPSDILSCEEKDIKSYSLMMLNLVDNSFINLACDFFLFHSIS